MKNLSGWSLLWITLSVTCVIGTVAKLIMVRKAKEAETKKADATT